MSGNSDPNVLTEHRFGVKITIAGVLLFLVILLTVVYYCFPDIRDTIEFFTLSLTAATGIASVFYLANTLKLTLERQKVELTFKLTDRWNSPEFHYSRRAMHEIFETFRAVGKEAVVAELEDALNVEKAMNVRHILNFFEEIAIAVRKGHVVESILEDCYKGPFVRAFNVLSDWIAVHRDRTQRHQLWEQGQWLYEKWKCN